MRGMIVKKRVFAIVLMLLFIFTSTAGVYAKSRSFGGSRSFSKSFSKSYKGSSKSGGLFGSSKAKSSTKSSTKNSGSSSAKSSSARSIPGTGKSYSGSSGSASKSFATKSASKKYSYMQDNYKKQVSGKNFNTYKQKLNADQQKVYNASMKRDFGTGSRRMNFEDALKSRSSRINSFGRRPVFINVNTGMFGNPFSYGYAYVGPWDLWFLMRASEMFWFHHWLDIAPYKSYFNQQEYEKLEKRVDELEKQGIQRDPNYVEPDADTDLQFSQQYQEENVDKIYYTDKYATNSAGSGVAVVVFVMTAAGLVIVVRKLSKPKRRKSHYSRIY